MDRTEGKACDLLRHARRIADALLSDGSALARLHGDLHHANVLQTDRADGPAWLATDPQGVWRDPAYEVANLFGNSLGHPDITHDPARSRRLADALGRALGLDPARILRCAFVHSAIAGAWSIEDGRDPPHRIGIAALIAPSRAPSATSPASCPYAP